MKNELINLIKSRECFKELKDSLDVKKKEFEANNNQLINSIMIAKEEIEVSEESIRNLAINEYRLYGDKKLLGGVGIRVKTNLVYDKTLALEWAKEHKLCLQLDKKGFENVAKSEDIQFVAKIEVVTATLPKIIKLEDEEK